MSNAGTLWLGYGVTIVSVLGYVLWMWRRARALGVSLGISDNEHFPSSDSQQTPSDGQPSM